MRHLSTKTYIAAVAALLWIAAYLWAHWGVRSPAPVALLLEWLAPAACIFCMAGLLIVMMLCHKEIIRCCKLLKPHGWLLLTALIGVTLVMRLAAVTADERIFYDEHTYLQIARGIADEGRAKVAGYAVIDQGAYRCLAGSYPHWSSGWPALMATVFWANGYDRLAGQVLNLILSLITIILIALITVSLFPGSYAWLAAAAIYASLPANQVWSRTSVSEVFAVFTAALAVLSALIFLRTSSLASGLLLATSTATAAYARNESILLIAVVAIFLISLGAGKAVKTALWPWIVMSILLLPQSLHLGIVTRNYDPLLTKGSGFAITHLLSNLASFGSYLYREPVLLLCIFFAILGCIGRRFSKAIFPVCFWGLSVFILPLFYFGSSYVYPGGERFTLAWLPAVAIAAGVGLLMLHAQLVRRVRSWILCVMWTVAFIFVMFQAKPHATHEDQKSLVPRADIGFLRAALTQVPTNGLVITSDPPLVLAEGRSAIFIADVCQNPNLLGELLAFYSDKLYYFISPSSSPDHWSGGKDCERKLFSSFLPNQLKQETSEEGMRCLYRLVAMK